MITKFKRLLLVVAAVATLSAPALVPAVAHAQNLSEAIACGSLFELNKTNCEVGDGAGTSLSGLLHRIINIFSVLVGIIAVIMIMVGGLKYITSGGESSKVTSAKNTIIYAIVGIVIVALSQFIVAFVLTNTAGI